MVEIVDVGNEHALQMYFCYWRIVVQEVKVLLGEKRKKVWTLFIVGRNFVRRSRLDTMCTSAVGAMHQSLLTITMNIDIMSNFSFLWHNLYKYFYERNLHIDWRRYKLYLCPFCPHILLHVVIFGETSTRCSKDASAQWITTYYWCFSAHQHRNTSMSVTFSIRLNSISRRALRSDVVPK